MMNDSFQFGRLPMIFFGRGRLSILPELISRHGKSIILVTGQHSFMESPSAHELLEVLSGQGIEFERIIIAGEPSPDGIDYAVRELGLKPYNVVVGIGGGSVLDAAKAISAMMYRKESVKDFLEGVGKSEHPGTKIPFIAIPTTSGTGSEATKNAVISSVGSSGFKKSLRHDNFIPDMAIVDPLLTLNCPRDITAATGTDCFSQLLEAYLSTKASVYTDALALEGIKAVKESLEQSVLHGDDITARTGMSFAALTSGICLANAGLGSVHGFASSIGGLFRIPHGALCGTLLAAANEINVRELRKNPDDGPALKKYSNLGRIFTTLEGKPDNYYIDSFIEYLKKLTDDFSLPLLHQFGISGKDVESICHSTDIKNNPVLLDMESLSEILTLRL